jgi:hypothetical protein
MLPAHNLLRTLRSDLEAARAARRPVFVALAISVGPRLFDDDELPWSSRSIGLPVEFGEPEPASQMVMVIDHADPTRFVTVAMFGDPASARAMRDHGRHLARAAGAVFAAARLDVPGLPARQAEAEWPLTLIRLAAEAPDAFRYEVVCSILPDDRADRRRADEGFREMIPQPDGRIRVGNPRWGRIASAIRGEWSPPSGLYVFAIDRDVIEASIEAADYLMALGPAATTPVARGAAAVRTPIDMNDLANELARRGHTGPSRLVRLFADRDDAAFYEVGEACCKAGEDASLSAIKSLLSRAKTAVAEVGGDSGRLTFTVAGDRVVKTVEPR